MNITFAWALGGMEVVLILAIVLILFGAKKIPELAKGLGAGIKEFKKATREVTDEIQNASNETPAKPAAPTASVAPTPVAPSRADLPPASNPPTA
jgi:sec-independent protein translocase protein TatA